MNSRIHVVATLLAVVFSTWGVASTSIPLVGWIISANTEEASIFILPDGSGPPLTQAMLFGGEVIDASIVVGVVNPIGQPVSYYPLEDVRLEPEVGTASSCLVQALGGFWADHDTDLNGEAFFSTSLAGGGWTVDPLWVYVNGTRAEHPNGWEHPPVRLRFNSADINADGVVDLIDVSIFATDFFGEYHYRSDFRWDGVLNLMDCEMLAIGFGKICD